MEDRNPGRRWRSGEAGSRARTRAGSGAALLPSPRGVATTHGSRPARSSLSGVRQPITRSFRRGELQAYVGTLLTSPRRLDTFEIAAMQKFAALSNNDADPLVQQARDIARRTAIWAAA